MIAQYLAIKADHPDCLLFFRMGDFYELFFADAEKAANALDITLTKRGKHKGEDIPMCGVPYHAAKSYIARLIRQGFKVAIAEQTEDTTDTGDRKRKTLVERKIRRIVTSGTVIEDSLLETRIHNFLAALVRINQTLAMAWLDVSTGCFRTRKLPEGTAMDLAALLERVDPAEILVAEPLLEDPDLAPVFKTRRQTISPLPQSRFDSRNGENRLCQAYHIKELTAFGEFSRSEIAAAGALLDYVELTQLCPATHLRPLQHEGTDSTLEIDPATIHNLELLQASDGDRRKGLVADIDYTLTGSGARLLRERLCAPTTRIPLITQRLDVAQACLEIPSGRLAMRKILKQMPDLERALSRLALQRGSARDLKIICDGLSLSQTLKETFGKDTPIARHWHHWVEDIDPLQDLLHHLKPALVTQLPAKQSDGGFIAPGYCETLDHHRNLRDHSRGLIAELQTRYISQTGISSLKIKQNNILGYFIEISATQIGKLDGDIGLRHRQTMAGATRFSSDELVALDVAIRQAGDQALALEMQIFDQLAATILAEMKPLRRLADAIARLDIALATAELATERDFQRPQLVEEPEFIIEGGRHPMVETALKKDDGSPFQANNCHLDQQNRLWLITGPNMAGKSTYLRQNALIVILAQAGLYVPATRARLGIVDRLFSRIGAADNLAQGRSTFMVEMIETATILHRATEHSFVILDEIGRGTATFDGLSIAWAVAEHLHETNRCRTLFATHYHELTALEQTMPHLDLYRMAVKKWQGEVKFLYAIEKGATQGSYGVHVAQLAGLPIPVVARAREILSGLETNEHPNPLAHLTGDLPLFPHTASCQNPAPQNPSLQDGRNPSHPESPQTDRQEEILKDALMTVDPDSLNPRQALDWLYHLKTLAEDQKTAQNSPPPPQKTDP